MNLSEPRGTIGERWSKRGNAFEMALNGPYSYYIDPGPQENAPKWAKTLGLRVSELVLNPKHRERWRRVVEEWAEEQRASRSPVKLLPRRALTLPEQYAYLAALHDFVCEGERIDPWYEGKCKPTPNLDEEHRRVIEQPDTEFEWTPERKAELAASWGHPSYEALLATIRRISDDHRERLEAALSPVIQDLTAHCTSAPPPSEPQRKASTPKARRWRSPRLTDRQREAWDKFNDLRSFTAVGKALGITRQAARKRIKGAQAKLLADEKKPRSVHTTHRLPRQL